MNDPYGSVETLISHLLNGWYERIEYKERVQVHSPGCVEIHLAPRYRHESCACPTVIEHRAENRHQSDLCIQLRGARFVKRVTVKDQGGGPPGKASKKPPPPGNLVEPDEIMFRLANVCRDALEPLRPYRQHKAFADDAELWVRELRGQLQAFNGKQLADITHQLSRVVRSARVLLGYESETVQFADTVCGQCGGALTAERIAPTKVTCAGSPLKPPCGKIYPWSQWAALFAAGPVLVDTETAENAIGRPRATLYRWASTGKVKRYGSRKQGHARWDLEELNSYQKSLDKRGKKREDTS